MVAFNNKILFKHHKNKYHWLRWKQLQVKTEDILSEWAEVVHQDLIWSTLQWHANLPLSKHYQQQSLTDIDHDDRRTRTNCATRTMSSLSSWSVLTNMFHFHATLESRTSCQNVWNLISLMTYICTCFIKNDFYTMFYMIVYQSITTWSGNFVFSVINKPSCSVKYLRF